MASDAIVIEVLGQPVGKARPRFTRFGHAYTPAKTVNYETAIKLSARTAMCGRQLLLGPLCLLLGAWFEIPQSWSKKKKEAASSGEIRPATKPDWDNVGKIVSDALNGVAYQDDAQIVESHIYKYYSDHPRLSITLMPVQNGDALPWTSRQTICQPPSPSTFFGLTN